MHCLPTTLDQTPQFMSPRSQSSAITPNIKLCIICNQDGYGCHCGTTFHQPSLLPPPLPYAPEQRHRKDDPFDDGHALPDSPIQQDTHHVTNRDIAAPGIGGIPCGDSSDGLPSSIPSRHTKTISGPSSRRPSQERDQIPFRFQDNMRARPAPLHLAPPSNQHHIYENSASITVDPFFRSLLASPASTAKQSPKRKLTIIDPSVYRRSQMALVDSAGQPLRKVESNRRVREINRLSVGSPAGQKARRAVTGQKQPFPLLSPVLVDEKPRTATQHGDRFGARDPEQHPSKEEHGVKSRIQNLLSSLQRSPHKLMALIVLLFQLCLMTSTTTIVIWIEDVKYKHVLNARIVAITIIAIAGCCTCVLAGCAQWLRQRQKTLATETKAESLSQRSRKNTEQSWNEKARSRDGKALTDSGPGMDRKITGMKSDKPSRSRIEDLERSPRFAHRHILSDQDSLSSASRNQRQEHKSTPQGSRPELKQQSSANSALPSSNVLPSRPTSDGSYRAQLESRLLSREHMQETSTSGGTSVNGTTINIEDIEQMIAPENVTKSQDTNEQDMTMIEAGSEYTAAAALLPSIQNPISNEPHRHPEPQLQPRTGVPTLTLNTPTSTSTIDFASPFASTFSSPFSPSMFPLPPTISMFPLPLAPRPRPRPSSSLLLPPANNNNHHRNNRPTSTPTLPSPPIQPLLFSISAPTPVLAPASAPFSTNDNPNPRLAAACWRGFSSNPNFGTWQLAILDRDWETVGAGSGGAWEKQAPGEEEWWMGVGRTDGKKVFSFSASSGSVSASISGGSGTITVPAEIGLGKERNGSGFIINNPDGSCSEKDTEYADSLVRAHHITQHHTPTATPTETGSIYSTTPSLIAAQQQRSRAKVLLWQKWSLDFPLAAPSLHSLPRARPRVEHHAEADLAMQERKERATRREEESQLGQVQRRVEGFERGSGNGNERRSGLGGFGTLWARRQKHRQRHNNRDRTRSLTRNGPTAEAQR